MTTLEKTIGYAFRNSKLLTDALTHSSYCNENRAHSGGSNERLEFLGDAVLGFLTAEHLYHTLPKRQEGDLSRRRAALVCEPALAVVAEKLKLGEHILLGKGERSGGGDKRPSILSDAVEAVLAAIYLDGGMEPARAFVERFVWTAETEKAADYKTMLQEVLQRTPGQEFGYRLAGESGPDHAKVFLAEFVLGGQVVGRGEGGSKKEAEQAAARQALEKLNT